MIALDTSALIAAVGREPKGEACERLLLTTPLVLSAGTLTEILIVAGRKDILPAVERTLTLLDLAIENVTPDFARRAAAAYQRWGKGRHKASLNYGDCFSYAVAELYHCPLLFVGDDFSQTDIRSALD